MIFVIFIRKINIMGKEIISKSKFCKRAMIWTPIVTMVIIAICGLCFGHVVEATLAEEIGKWVLMGLGISACMEVFAYILGPFFYHLLYDKKRELDPDEQ